MSDSKLTNDKEVQVVALKLDKSKSRELAFRMFLDQNELNGINRKETILRMFEYISGKNIISKDILMAGFQDSIPTTQPSANKNDIEVVKMNTNSIDGNDWDDI